MVSVQRRGPVAILTLNRPPVNAVSGDVAAAFSTALDQTAADAAIAGIVITGAGSNFIAGADIKMLSDVSSGKTPLPDLNSFLFQIENSSKPVVAAINGAALGGGLEVAMAAHYRVADAGAMLGQPEVKLGLIPGMGGTQRLPRLAGIGKALEMCVLGEPVSATLALQAGLVDQVAEANVVEEAILFLLHRNPTPLRTSDRNCSAPPNLFADWRERAHRTRRGEEAPIAVIDAIEAAQLPLQQGFAREQRLFRERLASSQSQALLHVFLGERSVQKPPTNARPVPITRAAVVGAGFMGRGIATVFANAGIPVRLSDVSDNAIEAALADIRRRCRNASLIDARPEFDGFETADIIVEAVFEDLSVKREAFTQIARVASSGAILATNTSTLDVDQIASAVVRPENVIGLHFFSPAAVMKLVEVVQARATSDEVIASAMAVAKRLNKVAVLARNQFGFIGNRMVMPYLREAHLLVEEGVSVERINQALYNFGMAMGPLAMEDLVGLDVTRYMRQEALRRGRLAGSQPRIADLLFQRGRYGQKTRAGWSLYNDSRQAFPNPEIAELTGNPQRDVAENEIVRRCLSALVAEGRALLAEGVARSSVDVDIVYVYGYGFPAWRGGPLFFSNFNAQS